MSNTEWLLLQLTADISVIWMCWVVYPYLIDFWYGRLRNDGHDEHEDVDQARG